MRNISSYNMIICYDYMRLMFERMNIVEKELLEYSTVTQLDWVCLGWGITSFMFAVILL